jgi:hypothetical protein
VQPPLEGPGKVVFGQYFDEPLPLHPELLQGLGQALPVPLQDGKQAARDRSGQ